MTNAEKIAKHLYPESWVESGGHAGLRIDNNAGRRACAVQVAERFLEVLNSHDTAIAVMKAFYRREHGREAHGREVASLTAAMATALLAYELALTDSAE